MYQDKFIAFVDLLGFGSLVERSGNDFALAEKILDALKSLQPKAIQKNAWATINYEKIPPEEIKDAEELIERMNDVMMLDHPVSITYFSDSLVISAPTTSAIASQMVLDILAKLSIKLWVEHSLVIRGGITLGKLVHIDNGGPLFGPAMNRAYLLESQKAIYPRIIIDPECLNAYRKVETFRLFESLFEASDDFAYMNLATAFRHILVDSTLVISDGAALQKHKEWYADTPSRVESLIHSNTVLRVKEKYQWLQNEFLKITF